MDEAAQLPLSDRLLAWYETNRKQALWGAVIIVVAGFVVGYFLWQRDQKEVAAGEALTTVSVPYTSGMVRSGDAGEAYLKIANTYPTSKSGARALLLAGGEFFVEGKYDQARSSFERFRREHGDSPLIGQAALGIAASHEAQGKTQEALAAYKDLIEHRPSDSAVPQAKFALANLYETQNKPEQAFALFEEIARSDAYSSLGSEAGMRSEELKQKYPNLAVPPPAPMNPRPTMITNRPQVLERPAPGSNGAAPSPGLTNRPGLNLTNGTPTGTNRPVSVPQ